MDNDEWIEVDASGFGPVGEKFFKFATARMRGQDKAIRKLARALDRYSSALKVDNRPIYISLTIGEAGSGKTLLAQILAEFWFGSPDAFTEIACSKFSEFELSQDFIVRHDLEYSKANNEPFKMLLDEYMNARDDLRAAKEAAKDVDGPDDNQRKELIEVVEKAAKKFEGAIDNFIPKFQMLRSIIVFDHIEDGPSRLQDELAMIFENGKLHSRSGDEVSFRNSVIFVTCNNYVRSKSKGSIGITASKNTGKETYLDNINAVKEYLTPKFLSHLDRVEIFSEYSHEMLREILDVIINDFKKRIASIFPLTIELDDDVKDFLIREGSDHPDHGIRLLKRKFDHYIRDKISVLISHNRIQRKDNIKVTLKKENKDDPVVFSKK